MKTASYLSWAGTFALTIATTLITNTPVRSEAPIFKCDRSSGVPATVVQSSRHGLVKIIEWKTTQFGDKFNPETRCNLVSQKFEKFAKAGTLKYFTTGSVNRHPVICAVASQNSPCNSESMLYTLRKDVSARETLKLLLDIKSGASGSALNETESRIYVDFDEIVKAKSQASQASQTTQASQTQPLF